jgi:hypothetical protein
MKGSQLALQATSPFLCWQRFPTIQREQRKAQEPACLGLESIKDDGFEISLRGKNSFAVFFINRRQCRLKREIFLSQHIKLQSWFHLH